MYLYSTELASRGQSHLEKKNIHFSADGGLKVGVKEVQADEYAAAQQGFLVKAWNYSTWPEYRSRYWNKQVETPVKGKGKKT